MDGISADWRKSTYSGSGGGTCIEVGIWRKSTYSGSNGGQCVEVGAAAPSVLVRDTTDRAGAALTIPAGAWRTLLGRIRAQYSSRTS
jgi:hypothetical protein